MNILIVVDKYQSAIDRLAQPLVGHNRHFNVKVLPVHPKRPGTNVLHEAQQLMMWADLIDIHYWRSGEVLRQSFPTEFEGKPKIVCHFNPYDYDKLEWLKHYDCVVVGNSAIQNKIPYAHLIPYCIDLGFWTWNSNYTDKKVVNMTVARIEGKKGVREVAEACKKLKYKFVLVGRVSNIDYMRDIVKAGGDYIEFKENITDSQLKEVYHNSAIHVCNSVDNFESGTLPILESMATGVPVLTRSVGHVPDLYNGKNMVIREESQEDVDSLTKQLKDLMENKEWRNKLRDYAWQTVKNRPIERMARMYSKLWYQVLEDKRPLVSIIMPVFDNHESFIKSLAHASVQDYGNIEIVVVDSGDNSARSVVDKFKRKIKMPIKFIRFENEGKYTLPKARNLGVMESEGEILVFCDQRIAMKKDAVTKFVKKIQNKKWLWGVKDGVAKGFVENFSCVRRDDFIAGGMFNERIDSYGGTTQEVRTRFESKQGFAFELIDEAQAHGIAKSGSKWNKKEQVMQSKLKLFKLYG